MTTADVYTWLFAHTPTGDDVQLKFVWSNMASYCYFISAIDFDDVYRDRLGELLNVSKKLGIQVPDQNHSNVLAIAKHMKTSGSIEEVKEKLHGHRTN